MDLLQQPRILQAKAGQRWLGDGFRLFHRQPLGWTMILFIYWAAMLMMAFVPIFGLIVPLLLTPGLSLGFIEVARSIDERRAPNPLLLVSAFRSPQARSVFLLGVWYVVEIVAILLITLAIDGGLLLDWITLGESPKPEQASSAQYSAVIAFALYIPVMMAFWFAPQLVVWSGFSPVKALFFSFFAVWRNRGAFLRYAITWVGLTLFVGASMALLGQVMDSKPSTMAAFLFPITLILMAVAHGSFYASTKSVFGALDQNTEIIPAEN